MERTMPSAWVQVWPEMQAGIRRSLQQRSVDADTADDIVQEVALRMSAEERTFRSVEHAVAWGRLVAVRIHVAMVRQQQRVEHSAVEVAASDDVARSVELRLAIETVARAWPQLRPADRAAILAGGQPVRRHRARARLAAMVGSAWGVFVGVVRGRRLAIPVALAASLLPLAVVVNHYLAAAPVEAPSVAAADTAAPAVLAPAATVARPLLPVAMVDAATVPLRQEVRPSPVVVERPSSHPNEVEVWLPQPPGSSHDGNGGVVVRPKRPDDHFVCADTVVAGTRCYDPPPLPWP